MATLIERFEQKFEKTEGCWEWHAGRNGNGYGAMYIGQKKVFAHRLSYELYIGRIPDNLCVLHKCDNPGCVNPEHLFLGTRKDNMVDKVSKDRQARGEKAGNVKLNSEKVVKVREMYSYGYLQQEIADSFGITNQTVSAICAKKTWKV